MKKTLLMLLSLALIFAMTAFGAGDQNQKRNRNASADCGLARLLTDLPYQNLTDDEPGDVLFMREEEKLARDVYLTLKERWNLRIFSNIAQAERNHMAAVATLIVKYELQDPVGNNAVGVFTNADLQLLYEQLAAAGQTSLISALQVGAAVEERDIFDLQQALARTDNEDLQMLYQNLLKGSINHLRAFDKQLTRRGASYTPAFFTVDEYQAILTTSKVKGVVDSDGVLLCGSDTF